MKSEVRSRTNDTEIDPKSDQYLDKDGAIFYWFVNGFCSLWALILSPFWHRSKNNRSLNPFWMDLGSLWGSTLRAFWPPKINEKTSLLQGSLQGRPMDSKSLQNDAKRNPKASKMDQKWNQNEAKRQPPGVTRIKKPTKFECKSGFQLGRTEPDTLSIKRWQNIIKSAKRAKTTTTSNLDETTKTAPFSGAAVFAAWRSQ